MRQLILIFVYLQSFFISSAQEKDTTFFFEKYHHKKSVFEALPNSSNEIVFLGNSIIEQGPWRELFQNPNIINRGIGGDTANGILYRLEEVIASKPNKIFLMVGTNDITTNHPKDVHKQVGYILQYIRKNTPNTVIYIHSILPTYNDAQRPIEKIKECNSLLKQYEDKKNIFYLDLFTHFADPVNNDQLHKKFSLDGLHLNDKGYLKWKEIIYKDMNDTITPTHLDLKKGLSKIKIFSHRGDWRNHPENSIRAIQSCINAGIDIVEIDVRKTKDNRFIVFHDDKLDYKTNGKGYINELFLDSIQNVFLKEGYGITTRQKIPTLDTILQIAKGKTKLYLDKAWENIPEIYPLLKKYNMQNEVYFGSSSPYNAVREKIGTYLDSVSFMPFVMKTTENRIDFMADYIQNIKSVKDAFVLIDDNPKDTKPLINFLKEQKIEITFSSTWANGSAGHDDELSFTNPNDGWGWLINFGTDAIFTDRPFLLKNFLEHENKESNFSNNIKNIKDRLLHPSDKHMIVVAHRGDWRNAPENSIQAITNSIKMGVDMVEIDVRLTKDSIPVLMHDETIDRTTTGKGRLSDWTYKDLKQIYLKNGTGRATHHKIPTLKEALDVAKGKIMINIDKGFNYFDILYPIIKQTKTEDHILMKGWVSPSEFKSSFKKYNNEILFMPVVSIDNSEAIKTLMSYESSINPLVYEIIFSELNEHTLSNLKFLQKTSAKLWVNSLWETLNAGYDDDKAIHNLDIIYGWYVENDIDIIQTDRPQLLLNYLKSRNLHQ